MSLADIDLLDTRFRRRPVSLSSDPAPSVAEDGQQVPITLWGSTRPYKIIDGFRRVQELQARGAGEVDAIVRDDLDEEGALALSLLLNLSPQLMGALVAGRLSMGHAIALDRPDLENVDEWVRKAIQQGLSVGELRAELERLQPSPPRSYIVKDRDGFRVTPFRYHPDLPEQERRRILEAIEAAAEIVRADGGEDSVTAPEDPDLKKSN